MPRARRMRGRQADHTDGTRTEQRPCGCIHGAASRNHVVHHAEAELVGRALVDVRQVDELRRSQMRGADARAVP